MGDEDMFGSVFSEVKYELHDLNWEEWTVIELDGELISELWVFYDRAAAEAQAGV